MRPVVLLAAIGASAVLGGLIGGALVRVIDRPDVADAADIALAIRHTVEISSDLVKLSDYTEGIAKQLRTLELVVGGCSCPKPH